MANIKENLSRISMSFFRAFVGGLVLTQGIDLQNLRGVAGVVLAAATAGIAAALRTAESLLNRKP